MAGALLGLLCEARCCDGLPGALAKGLADGLDAGQELPLVLEPQDSLDDPGLAELQSSPGQIGKRLGVGARLGVFAILVRCREPDEARKEQDIHLLIQQVLDMAERHLGGEAGLCHGGFDPAVRERAVRLVGENNAEAQLIEEGLPEGQLIVQVQRPRDAHDRPVHWLLCRDRRGNALLPQGEKVGKLLLSLPPL
ncbi:MAG: hypothetical protein H6R44_1107, partial [Nitrospirae bacterium]|nr:hypothetical protein [Nitrospirota bacterium]